jgi:hypothetical protein
MTDCVLSIFRILIRICIETAFDFKSRIWIRILNADLGPERMKKMEK